MLKRSIKYIIILALLSVSLSGNAQEITVTGKVIDKHGRFPISYVYVSAKHDSVHKVVTDDNGYYSINVNPNSILRFSYIGYIEIVIFVNGKTKINIELEEEGNSCYSTKQRSTAHNFSILGTYAFNNWGYGVEYAYIPPINNTENPFNKVLRYTDLNIRIQSLPHSNNLRFFPHLRISMPVSIPLFTHQKLSPYINAGYYFDTDFKTIPQHNWAIGGGVNTPLTSVRFKRKFMNIHLMAGYTLYPKTEKKDFIYLGLKFYLNNIIFIE